MNHFQRPHDVESSAAMITNRERERDREINEMFHDISDLTEVEDRYVVQILYYRIIVSTKRQKILFLYEH